MERLETHAALDKPLIVTCSPEHSVRHTHTPFDLRHAKLGENQAKVFLKDDGMRKIWS